MAEGDTFSINSITFCNNLEKTTKGGLFGEVMIEFPKMGYKFESINNTQKISVTRKTNYSDFCYDAFKRGDKYNDYIYISVYDATRTSNEDRVHSLDRVNSNINYASSTVANTQSITDLRNWTGLSNDWSILTF